MARSGRVIVVNELGNFAAKVVKRLTLDVTATLVEDTPRDTGWARNNWVPGIGNPPAAPYGTREQAEAGNLSASQTARQRGEAIVATSYTINSGNAFIANNVPYIEDLDRGSSPQAAAGFVQKSIDKAIARNRNLRP